MEENQNQQEEKRLSEDEYYNRMPPGSRFHPTDEELIVHYLKNKNNNQPLPFHMIREVKLYESNPQQLTMETLVAPIPMESQRLALENKSENMTDNAKRLAPVMGGCRIKGFVCVKKVSGNIIISARSGAHSFDASQMNMSHVISHLSFGRKISARVMSDLKRMMPYLGRNYDKLNGQAYISHRDFNENVTVTDSHYEFLGSFLGSNEKAKDAIFYSYKRHINGFAVTLEEEDAAEISKHPKVVSFPKPRKNGVIHPSSLWKRARFGEDTIIGNIDTVIF